jgi:hypothetical protein
VTGNEVLELELPVTPPSLNRLGAQGAPGQGPAWKRYNDEKQKWGLVLASKIPRRRLAHPAARARCCGHLRFETNRSRDEGNFRYLLEKALGDALVRQCWIADDDWQRYTFERLHFDPSPGPPRTLVVVELETP